MKGIVIRSEAQGVRGLFTHGTGVAIGETAIVEDDAVLDHRITLPVVGNQ